ncbi:aminodeoxychorismate lyase [Ahrensia sp. R2A130]|nr:endolytic transglycosylase MltG [Ahrensia sp. R2A130]EFL90599.1 aminodeoxychorismate lyase [Ahrensia sp. R2A130]
MSDNDTPFGRQPRDGASNEAGGYRPRSEYALPPQAQGRPAPQTPEQPRPEPVYEYRDSVSREGLEPVGELPPTSDPRTKRRSRSAKSMTVRLFNFIMTLAIIGALLFVGSVWYGKTQFEARGPLEQDTTFEVPRGATFASIITGLEQQNIIPQQGPLRVFLRGVQSSGKASDLKAGEFAFNPGMSMRQVMMQLTEGRAITRSVTFPEGWTSYRIVERIIADERLTGDVLAVPAEGSLLPNTYAVQKGDTRDQLIVRMKDAQQKSLREIWNSRADGLPLKSPEELVILASIVEKETGIGSERPHVASVFINRLNKGMRLQTDPTVIYGIWGGEGKPKDRGGLRRSELDRQTPYNTYQINGLPPTPIANPGRASMEAVANPLQTDDFYFVADGTGGHVFSKTLAEHNANVKKWRAIEAQRKQDAEKAASEDADADTSTAN